MIRFFYILPFVIAVFGSSSTAKAPDSYPSTSREFFERCYVQGIKDFDRVYALPQSALNVIKNSSNERNVYQICMKLTDEWTRKQLQNSLSRTDVSDAKFQTLKP